MSLMFLYFWLLLAAKCSLAYRMGTDNYKTPLVSRNLEMQITAFNELFSIYIIVIDFAALVVAADLVDRQLEIAAAPDQLLG